MIKGVLLGIDLIKNTNGYYFLEINTDAGGYNSYRKVSEKGFFPKQLVDTCKERNVSTLCILDTYGMNIVDGSALGRDLEKLCMENGVALKILGYENGANRNFTADDSLVFRIAYDPNKIIEKVTDSKKLTQEAFEPFTPDGFLLPETKNILCHNQSRFPKIVAKEDSGWGGRGINFFNTLHVEEINADITQEYIIPECSNYRLIQRDGSAQKEYFDGERVCDIRSLVMYLHYEDPIFMGCYKRWAPVNLPENLGTGLVPDELRNAYLTNISQGGLPGHIEWDEAEEIKQISFTLCRTLKTIIENTDAPPNGYF